MLSYVTYSFVFYCVLLCVIVFISLYFAIRIGLLIYSAQQLQECLINLLTYYCTEVFNQRLYLHSSLHYTLCENTLQQGFLCLLERRRRSCEFVRHRLCVSLMLTHSWEPVDTCISKKHFGKKDAFVGWAGGSVKLFKCSQMLQLVFLVVLETCEEHGLDYVWFYRVEFCLTPPSSYSWFQRRYANIRRVGPIWSQLLSSALRNPHQAGLAYSNCVIKVALVISHRTFPSRSWPR